MFLVEWKAGQFVDAHKITNIGINKRKVHFTLINEPKDPYKVADDLASMFLNNVSALDCNKVGLWEALDKQLTEHGNEGGGNND